MSSDNVNFPPVPAYPPDNMECGICEQRMWMYGNGAVHDPVFGITDPTRRIWRCRNNEHPPLPHMAAVDIVGYVLREAVLHPALIAPPNAPRELPDYANLPTLQAQRARLQEGFMAGIFTAVEFHERAASIDDKIKAIEEGRAQVEKAQDRRKNFLAALGGLFSMAARIPEWLATEDPPVVNTTLRTVLAGIVWHAERGTVTLRWDDK